MTNNSWYHLALFVVAGAVLLTLVLTGHDSGGQITFLLQSIVAGVLGGSGGSTLAAAFTGASNANAAASQSPVVVQLPKQGGFIRWPFMVVMLICAFIAACASLQSVAPSTPTVTLTQAQAVETGCASASSAIKTLTVAQEAGKLTLAQQQTVTGALAVVSPLCTSAVVPSYSDVQAAALTASVAQLMTLAVKYKPASATTPPQLPVNP